MYGGVIQKAESGAGPSQVKYTHPGTHLVGSAYHDSQSVPEDRTPAQRTSTMSGTPQKNARTVKSMTAVLDLQEHSLSYNVSQTN